MILARLPQADAPTRGKPMSEQSTPPVAGRMELVDLARGIALLAMFVFHFVYDLSFFGLIATDVTAETGWRLFARAIAGSFLTLVGFSFVLATRRGLNPRAWMSRFAMVAGAAALVTLGTWFFIPQNFIFFGILHHIALASVLALAFRRLPAIGLALASLACFLLPHLVDHPALDMPWLSWLGLSQAGVRSADFVPVFPWFGCVLAGMALARLVLARAPAGAWTRWQATSLPARLVTLGGRNSLLVYLVHQPLLIGALLIGMQVMGGAGHDERPFLDACQRSCVAAGSPQQICQQVCSCTVAGMKRENLWEKALANTLTPEQGARTTQLAEACYR